MPRWHVAQGGYPDGWEPPFLKTDDANEAINAFEQWTPPYRMSICRIFDDACGEGQPLDPHQVEDILQDEYERTQNAQDS
jgi:hypothetical protein